MFESRKWCDSPYINHFVSADTIVASYDNPQSLNRYSYVNNNPLRYTDPTGHMLDKGDGAGSSCPDQRCKDEVKIRKQLGNFKKNIQKCLQNLSACPQVEKKDGIFPIKKQFSWGALDWWDIGINVVGGLGEVGLYMTPAGNVPGPAEWTVSEAVELIGVVRDAYKNDYSALSKDGASKVISVVLEQKNSRDLIPVIGIAFNAINIVGDIRNAYVDTADDTPYSPPTIGPAP